MVHSRQETDLLLLSRESGLENVQKSVGKAPRALWSTLGFYSLLCCMVTGYSSHCTSYLHCITPRVISAPYKHDCTWHSCFLQLNWSRHGNYPRKSHPYTRASRLEWTIQLLYHCQFSAVFRLGLICRPSHPSVCGLPN